MPNWIPVAKVADISPGQMKLVVANRERLILVNVEGEFYIINDQCGHQRFPLSKGKLNNYSIECPLHFAQFDVRTGELITGPLAEAVETYDVKVEGDTIFVDF